MSSIMEGSGDAEWSEDEQHEDSSSSGSEVNNMEEEQQFDINLAAEHSYMGTGLVCVSGRSVLEEGWRGRVPVLAHHGAVFPGETVPLLRADARDAALLAAVIRQDKLFGLLCPNETGTMVSGYGVLCEVFETSAGWLEGGAAQSPAQGGALVVKARATQRFRFVHMPRRDLPLHKYSRIRAEWVRVLPELAPPPPLRAARLASLDPHRRPLPPPAEQRRDHPLLEARLRRLDAALTPWPPFVYDIFDYQRMRHTIRDYCKTIGLESEVPDDPTSLSFWAASNLTLTTRDRFRLFVADNALLRLRMEVRIISQHRVLCCAECAGEISRREHIFPMSSEGVHSNYTNPGGYMHDVVTVSRVSNTALSGRASDEYSWFPGYTWTIALCAACTTHIGWRFDATRRSLRPQRFYGLCRNTVQPRSLSPAPRDLSPAPTAAPAPGPGALVPRDPSDDSDADAP